MRGVGVLASMWNWDGGLMRVWVWQVEELELSKGKATDLLKAHEGDAVKAMRAFVTASA